MQIKGITFTGREADIIACIMYLKDAKKIPQILAVSPRTIEGHIQNIACILDYKKYKHLSEISLILKEAGVIVEPQGANCNKPRE